MSIIIKSGSSSDLATVNTNNEVLVALSALPGNAGFANLSAQNDTGAITGTPTVQPAEITGDYRLRVGIDTPFLSEAFLGTNINTANWRQTLTSFTVSQTGGYLRLNAANSTTASQGALITTYRSFPLLGTFPTYFEATATYTSQQANCVIEIGAGIMTGVAAPTDGAFFRLAAGEMRCVINNATVETQSAALTQPSINERHKYTVVLVQDGVTFWLDDVLQATIPTPSSQDSPTASNYLPMCFRIYNSGTTASAVQLLIADCFVSVGDANTNRNWETQMVGMGGGAYQAQNGAVPTQSANYPNSAIPLSAVLSNTTAGYATLGGQFQFASVAGAETDYALFAFLVPAIANTISGKNLIVTGIGIDTVNTGAAVATTATLLQWAVGVGSTAVPLATAEGAGTKATRRVPLGFQTFPIGAAIGAQALPIDIKFDAPLFVEAGTYVHILLKVPLGSATSSIIRGVVRVNGYYE